MVSEEEPGEGGERPEGGKKSYWWLTLCLLLVFLAGGGYLALSAMRQSAQKLAGVENPSQLSADAVYSGDSARGKADNIFPPEEPAPAVRKEEGSSLNEKLKPGWVKEMVAEAAAKGAGAQGAAAGNNGDGASQGGASSGGASSGAQAAAQQAGGAMAARLQAKAGFGGHDGAASSKTGGGASAVDGFQADGTGVGKPQIQKETKSAGAPRKGGGGGVMEALKGAFRASFYGARIASQDAAKGWIARSFDATPEAETSIEYDADMKAKLDVVNPNSIPKFLRDQDVTAAEAKTLPASQVSSPAMDKEGTKEALAEDKDYQKKKAASDLAKSVINPLFAGLGDLGDIGSGSGASAPTDPTAAANTAADPAAATTKGVTKGADPNADPSLGSVDENGNTTLSGSGGMNYIFAPDGKLLGCDNGSMCILPGGDGCSAGLSLS